MSSDNLHVINYSFLPTPEVKKKKRIANCFFLFRQEMMKERPHRMTMSDYSKQVSEMWEGLSDDQKNVWKKKYELNREAANEI
ncbi:hypothetical protein C1645_774140 [Glomus cerebriforme]|uniref:HMG box domain-containing protein n=1 Tax=Glomus cerebriforme TaxID=658196 RepID=A0A397T150_9GLOM|nr:hypothetical protein C1645_774140 [Glomus cerebriforme]